MRMVIGLAGAMLIGGCSGGDAPAKKEIAGKLGAGLYEVTADVGSLASTDKTTPATKLKLGDKVSARACVGADGTPEAALLAEAGDTCKPNASYVRNGRMSLQLACTRAGANGNVLVAVDGKITADGFDSSADTITQFIGPGNYKMTRKLTAKRVGDCPAGGVKAAS